MTISHHGRALALVLLLAASAAAVATVSEPLESAWQRKLHRAADLQAYSACGAGDVFTLVECGDVVEHADLQPQPAPSHSSGDCPNYIQCGDGGGELYTVRIETYSGKDKYTQEPKYYAFGSAVRMGCEHTDTLSYCWKRRAAGGDGCGCVCAVILSRSILGNRPECKCVY